MKSKHSQMYWHIEGYDGSQKIYAKRIKLGQMTEQQVKAVLRALVAKAGLTFDEIVGAYGRRGSRLANGHLLVQRDAVTPTFFCGDNPHFVASVRDSNGKVPRQRIGIYAEN